MILIDFNQLFESCSWRAVPEMKPIGPKIISKTYTEAWNFSVSSFQEPSDLLYQKRECRRALSKAFPVQILLTSVVGFAKSEHGKKQFNSVTAHPFRTWTNWLYFLDAQAISCRQTESQDAKLIAEFSWGWGTTENAFRRSWGSPIFYFRLCSRATLHKRNNPVFNLLAQQNFEFSLDLKQFNKA